MYRFLFVLLALVGSATSDAPHGHGGHGNSNFQVIDLGAKGGGGGGGGVIHGPLVGPHGGGYGEPDCYPQFHYETHYRTEVQKVPIYKTVLSSRLEQYPVNSVIYETVYNPITSVVTEIDYVTEVDLVTRVSYDTIVSTKQDVFYVPDFSTQTVSLVQDQQLQFTANAYETEYTTAPYRHTQYSDVTVTITRPVTLTHRSQVVNNIAVTTTRRATEYERFAVTVTVDAPPVEPNVVTVTNQVVNVKPSYVSTTLYQTQYVTTTNVERHPVVVTQTAYSACQAPGYSYQAPAVAFDTKQSGAGAAAAAGGYSYPEPAIQLQAGAGAAAAAGGYSYPEPAIQLQAGAGAAAAAGGYSYPEPAIGFDIRQSGATAGPVGGSAVLSAIGGPVSLPAAAGPAVGGGFALSTGAGPAVGGGLSAGAGPAFGGGLSTGAGPAFGGGLSAGAGPAFGGGLSAGAGPAIGGGGAPAGGAFLRIADDDDSIEDGGQPAIFRAEGGLIGRSSVDDSGEDLDTGFGLTNGGHISQAVLVSDRSSGENFGSFGLDFGSSELFR